ncbi:hypothetical protein D9619_003912 [Psilocybe cf. subviscida]|uniref:Uncharacterized protein n=1 Tax=Psilocybe cf. subviscida TaxID=2480587 RepID=A0A8H5F861_9AGAR|nr:hypothetical protein D9619_003912 [Psilocybe cf. subviscida]
MDPTLQPYVDGMLGSLVLQTLLTGFHCIIFFQTLIPIIRKGHQKVYATALTALFGAVIVNLGCTWLTVRNAFVVKNNSQESIAAHLPVFSPALETINVFSAFIAIFTADLILVSRCYIVCARSNIVLYLFAFLCIGEIVLVFIPTIQAAKTPHLSIWASGPIFYSVSLVITILATLIIILRITFISRKGGGGLSRYSYIMEVLVESGILYAAPLMVTVIFIVMTRNYITESDGPIIKAMDYLTGIITPMTGIAPTLIAFRVATGRARSESSWSQPLSALHFRSTVYDSMHTDTVDGHTTTSNV